MFLLTFLPSFFYGVSRAKTDLHNKAKDDPDVHVFQNKN